MNLSVLLSLFVLLPALSFAGSTRAHYGIVTNLDSEAIADRVSDLGVAWVRITVYWDQVEPSKGRFNWSGPDASISRATERGLKVFVTIHATPGWARKGKSAANPPEHARDWKEFVSAVAERYKNQASVRAYGMWNEPDLKKFWTGNQNDYINKILIPGSEAVKAANSKLLVAAPEFSQHWVGSKDWSLPQILETAGDSIDVITQHYYPDNNGSFDKFLDREILPIRAGKNVWITECGMVACSSARCTEDQQSHYLYSLLKIQQARFAWVKKIFPYRIWDPVDHCNADGNGFGITYGNPIRERPSYQTYQDFIDHLPFDDPSPKCHPASN